MAAACRFMNIAIAPSGFRRPMQSDWTSWSELSDVRLTTLALVLELRSGTVVRLPRSIITEDFRTAIKDCAPADSPLQEVALGLRSDQD